MTSGGLPHAESTARPEPRGFAGHVRSPHPGLRHMVVGDYLGFEGGDALSNPLLLPATATIPVLVTLVDPPHRPPAFLHGAHADYAVQEGPCAPEYLQLMLAPLGAYQLLGLPVPELGPSILDLHHVFGASAGRLLEQVRESTTWADRFDAIDSFLLAAAEEGPRPAPEVARAYELLTRGQNDQVRVAEVAAEVGWSHQHLITRFTQQVGLTPKRVARIARFERIVARAARGHTSDWGRIAAEHGYADQSHLIRDFRTFAGTTPARFPSAAV
jgi:AraC-like DNA-binding protein